MYKIQTSFFAGDATMHDDFSEVATYEEALNFIMNNKPPSEYEWDIMENGKGYALVWTQWGGQKISAYIEGKVVVLRDFTY